MKLQYVREDITIARLQALASKRITRVTVGWVEVGTETVADEADERRVVQAPITRRGVEIEIDGDLSAAELRRIDSFLARRHLSRKAL